MCYVCVIVLEQSVFNADKENANHPIPKGRERESEGANDWNCQSTSAQIGYVLNDMAIRLSVIAVSKNGTFAQTHTQRTREI